MTTLLDWRLACAPLALLATIATAEAQGKGDAAACSALQSLTLDRFDLKVESAAHVTEGAPHCLLSGSIENREGVGGKPYAIGFAIALPDEWTGRLLFQGGGGLNGLVRPPLGAAAAGKRSALERGFAVISNDSGHKGENSFDPSFKEDQIAVLNFSHASVEKVTLLAKEIAAAYYDQPAARSYFAGCSTGGREAMTAAQRYPELFDGIIAGAPAMRTNYSNLSLAWKAVEMSRISPKGDDGKPDRSKAFSDADRQVVLDGILKACDGLDGAEDGMIFDTKGCSFDPAALVCQAGSTNACITAEQAQVVKAAFAPLTDTTGRERYVSFPADTGVNVNDDNAIPGLLRFDSPRNRQARNLATEFDVEKEIDKLTADPQQQLINSDNWTDLGSYAGKGGKLIFFHGMSDPWFSANDTVDYFARMDAATGKKTPTDEWARLYLVPGMAHCRGGPGALDQFDLLTSLVDWVEEGKAPAAVTATGAAFPDRSRPLCPYPSHAQYAGSGDMEKAQSFSCK